MKESWLSKAEGESDAKGRGGVRGFRCLALFLVEL